jgi:hypothetical protein
MCALFFLQTYHLIPKALANRIIHYTLPSCSRCPTWHVDLGNRSYLSTAGSRSSIIPGSPTAQWGAPIPAAAGRVCRVPCPPEARVHRGG